MTEMLKAASARPIGETLDLALSAIDAASKGFRRSDAEDDWQECIVCHGWIDHHGHSGDCKLIAAGNALRQAIAEGGKADPINAEGK